MNCMSQNRNRPSSTWVGNLAKVGYLVFAAVTSLATFRSGALAVEHTVQTFSASLSAGCKESEAALPEHAAGCCLA